MYHIYSHIHFYVLVCGEHMTKCRDYKRNRYRDFEVHVSAYVIMKSGFWNAV